MKFQKHNKVLAQEKTNLSNVFDEVPNVASKVVQILEAERGLSSLKELRLSSRSFRRAVDLHVTQLCITVRFSRMPLLESGHLPSLDRWPSCVSLRLRLMLDMFEYFLAAVLVVPFVSLGPAGRQRIREVKVAGKPASDEYEPYPLSVGAFVASLLPFVPNLRRLDINSTWGLSFKTADCMHMYRALASFPCLENLHLPALALEGIDTLAESALKSLSIAAGFDPLSPKALEGISKLQGLTDLEVRLSEMPQRAEARESNVRLLQLLNHLPPHLTEMMVECYVITDDGGKGVIVTVALTGDRMSEVKVTCATNDWIKVQLLGPYMRAFLECGPLQGDSQLDLLTLEYVELPDAQCLELTEQRPLRELMARSKHVALKRLGLQKVDASDVGSILEVLEKPYTLALSVCGLDEARLVLHHGPGPSAWAAGSQPPPADPESLARAVVPSAEEVVRRATRWLVGEDLSMAIAGSLDPASEDTASVSRSTGLLLLRGSLMQELSQPPGDLHGFVVGLNQSAGVIVRLRSWREQGGNLSSFTGKYIVAYRVLPSPAAAVVLDCGEQEEAAAAVAAAVRAAAQELPPGALEVAPVVRHPGEWAPRDRAVFVEAVEQVLQAVWDNRTSNGAAALGEKELLRRILGVVRELKGKLRGRQLEPDEEGTDEEGTDEEGTDEEGTDEERADEQGADAESEDQGGADEGDADEESQGSESDDGDEDDEDGSDGNDDDDDDSSDGDD